MIVIDVCDLLDIKEPETSIFIETDYAEKYGAQGFKLNGDSRFIPFVAEGLGLKKIQELYYLAFYERKQLTIVNGISQIVNVNFKGLIWLNDNNIELLFEIQ